MSDFATLLRHNTTERLPTPAVIFYDAMLCTSHRTLEQTYYLHFTYIHTYIQGVPGGMDKTSGECSLC